MLGFGNGRTSSCWVLEMGEIAHAVFLEMGEIAHAGFWKWEK